MSLYSTACKIDGVPCGLVLRGARNGAYVAIFERSAASLEDIEQIDWSQPEIQGECVLPPGYGFDVKDIAYRVSDHTYAVTLQVGQQYLGDVTGYQAQVAGLQAEIAELETQLAEADELAISLYEAQLTAADSAEEVAGASDSGEVTA